MANPKKATHRLKVHPLNGIDLGSLGHQKHGTHELTLSAKQLEELAEAEGITLEEIQEEKPEKTEKPAGTTTDPK